MQIREILRRHDHVREEAREFSRVRRRQTLVVLVQRGDRRLEDRLVEAVTIVNADPHEQ